MTKIGTQISHYTIEKKIGEGGMGIVYRATDRRLFRPVALKILPDHLISIKEVQQRLIQEARAASSLNHPNICSVFDVGEYKGSYFIVMEYLEGETLREILKRRDSLPETEVIEIAIQICEALAAAHEKGIIHRDIKPDNIMIKKNGRIKVMDFGLAKISDQFYDIDSENQLSILHSNIKTSFRTSFSTFQGTVNYMSPEQIDNEKVDSRTDIFSLGIVLYELLTGEAPFAGKDDLEIMQSILHYSPKPIL